MSVVAASNESLPITPESDASAGGELTSPAIPQTFLERIQALRVAPPNPDSGKWQAHYEDRFDLIREKAEDAIEQRSGAFFLLFGVLLIGISIMKSSVIISFFAMLFLIVFAMSFTGVLVLIRRKITLFKRKDRMALERLKSVDRAAFQKWKADLNALALEWATQEKREKGMLCHFLDLEEHLDLARNTKLQDLLRDLKASLEKNECAASAFEVKMLELETERDALIRES